MTRKLAGGERVSKRQNKQETRQSSINDMLLNDALFSKTPLVHDASWQESDTVRQESDAAPDEGDEVWDELEPLPGAVVAQFIRCGKPGCRCQTGDKHGPYYYRIWREGSRVHKVYVPMPQQEEVMRQCALHQYYSDRLKQLVAERERLTQSLQHEIKRMKDWIRSDKRRKRNITLK